MLCVITGNLAKNYCYNTVIIVSFDTLLLTGYNKIVPIFLVESNKDAV